MEEPVAACTPAIVAEGAFAHKAVAATVEFAAVAAVGAEGHIVVGASVELPVDNILDLPAAVKEAALLGQRLDQKQIWNFEDVHSSIRSPSYHPSAAHPSQAPPGPLSQLHMGWVLGEDQDQVLLGVSSPSKEHDQLDDPFVHA